MIESNWRIANSIASELTERQTDVNEVQKALSFARAHAMKEPSKAGQQFFAFLNTVNRDGRYVVRSGRTLDYYRDLLYVCERHLAGYRTTAGGDAHTLVEILAWAVRLMRYYNTDEGADELAMRRRTERSQGSEQDLSVKTAKVQPPTKPKELPKIALRQAPPTGVSARETVTLLTGVKGGRARIKTSTGDEISCTNVPSYPPSQPGESCRAEITRENGKAVKAIFKGWN